MLVDIFLGVVVLSVGILLLDVPSETYRTASRTDLMVYTRGSLDDFNRWARVTGDSGWSWDEMFPYFLKVWVLTFVDGVQLNTRQNERFVQPTDGRNITGDFDPSIHGYDGMTQISVPNHLQKLFDMRCFEAADELRGNFEFTLDMNNGTLLGTGGYFKRLLHYALNI